MSDNTNKSDFYSGLGAAAVILSLCLGLSTCAVVMKHVEKQNIEIKQMKEVPSR